MPACVRLFCADRFYCLCSDGTEEKSGFTNPDFRYLFRTQLSISYLLFNMAEKDQMSVIDFHSHFLPGIDDGSRSLEESVRMLAMTQDQGVDFFVATPHFYADRDRIDDFLARREDAYRKVLGTDIAKPRILLGAEVAFFSGISRAADINRVCLAGTDILLLEMPFRTWKEEDIEEVDRLIRRRGFRVMLAHLERFLMYRENKGFIYDLMDMDTIVQVNSGSLLKWQRRGPALKLLKYKGIGLLGSDCHRSDVRVQNLGEGRAVLRKKLGDGFMDEMDRLGADLLNIRR